jgi:hypothetical protein
MLLVAISVLVSFLAASSRWQNSRLLAGFGGVLALIGLVLIVWAIGPDRIVIDIPRP